MPLLQTISLDQAEGKKVQYVCYYITKIKDIQVEPACLAIEIDQHKLASDNPVERET